MAHGDVLTGVASTLEARLLWLVGIALSGLLWIAIVFPALRRNVWKPPTWFHRSTAWGPVVGAFLAAIGAFAYGLAGTFLVFITDKPDHVDPTTNAPDFAYATLVVYAITFIFFLTTSQIYHSVYVLTKAYWGYWFYVIWAWLGVIGGVLGTILGYTISDGWTGSLILVATIIAFAFVLVTTVWTMRTGKEDFVLPVKPKKKR